MQATQINMALQMLSLWALKWPYVAAQTPDIHVALGGNTSHEYPHRPQLLLDHGSRHGPLQQPGPGWHYGSS